MARARRLVTSLARLLATKSEVVSQIRKRFLISGPQTTSPQGNEDVEIAIYMGDVQGKTGFDRLRWQLNSFRSYFDPAAISSSL
jgi:Mg2+ and Co2+ transporter CorA